MSGPGLKILIGTALVLVLLLGVLPVALVVGKALASGTDYWAALESEGTLDALWNTLLLATGTSLLALGIGTPLAWLTTRTDLPCLAFFRSTLTIPYIIPPYVAAVAWINLANPRVGVLNVLLGEGTLDIYSMTGLVWVLSLSFFPYVFLTVRAALENADPALEDAARMSGARTWRLVRDVTFPLVRAPMLGSAALVFMVTASAFGAPVLIGGPARIEVLSTRIYESLASGLGGMAEASALATLLVPLALLPLLLRPTRHAQVGGKASRPTLIRLGRARTPILVMVHAFVGVAILLPALAVTLTAFMRVAGDLSWGNLTTENFRLLARRDDLQAIGTSLALAGGAATLAVLIGGAAAFVQVKTRTRGRSLLTALTGFPLAMPGTVLAIGLILVWTSPLTLTNTVWILLLAYVAKYTALAARAIAEGLGTIDDVLPDAARISGARGLFLLRTIWLPLALPAVWAGWFLVFMPAFSELTMSVILVGPGLETVGTRMFELREYEGPTAASVLATVILALVVGSNVLLRVVSRGRYGI